MKKIIIAILAISLSGCFSTKDNSERELAQLEAKIERIEKKCTPSHGTTKENVERIFGVGKPVSNSKIPPKDIPPDLPYRSYKLCDNGILLVRYDDNNKVILAQYIDPYSTKGIPKGQTLPIEMRLNEARQRLKQLEFIEKEYLKKIKEKL